MIWPNEQEPILTVDRAVEVLEGGLQNHYTTNLVFAHDNGYKPPFSEGSADRYRAAIRPTVERLLLNSWEDRIRLMNTGYRTEYLNKLCILVTDRPVFRDGAMCQATRLLATPNKIDPVSFGVDVAIELKGLVCRLASRTKLDPNRNIALYLLTSAVETPCFLDRKIYTVDYRSTVYAAVEVI